MRNQLLEELMCGNGKSAQLATVEQMKAAMARPQLKGLKRGDVLVQVKGDDGNYSYKGDDSPQIFERYLSREEQIALFTGAQGSSKHDMDIIIVSDVMGCLPIRHPVDSRAYKLVTDHKEKTTE